MNGDEQERRRLTSGIARAHLVSRHCTRREMSVALPHPSKADPHLLSSRPVFTDQKPCVASRSQTATASCSEASAPNDERRLRVRNNLRP